MDNLSSANLKMILFHSLRNCNTIIWGKKNYSKKLFWSRVDVAVNAAAWECCKACGSVQEQSLYECH